jgi:hypothetical protein
MIEAAMIWNEPNNKSHWDLEADPDWAIFGRMAALAGRAIAAEAPRLPRVLGGMSPIDPAFLQTLGRHGALDEVAGEAEADCGGDEFAGLGVRGRGFHLWGGGGAGMGVAAQF